MDDLLSGAETALPGPQPRCVWDSLYARGVNLTANCRGVLAAPVLAELGFCEIRREYMAQMLFPTEIVTAGKPVPCGGSR
jgi:hypothetical protein